MHDRMKGKTPDRAVLPVCFKLQNMLRHLQQLSPYHVSQRANLAVPAPCRLQLVVARRLVRIPCRQNFLYRTVKPGSWYPSGQEGYDSFCPVAKRRQ